MLDAAQRDRPAPLAEPDAPGAGRPPASLEAGRHRGGRRDGDRLLDVALDDGAELRHRDDLKGLLHLHADLRDTDEDVPACGETRRDMGWHARGGGRGGGRAEAGAVATSAALTM